MNLFSQSEQSKIEAAGPDADSKANLLMEMCSTMDDNSRQRIKENLRRNVRAIIDEFFLEICILGFTINLFICLLFSMNLERGH